MKNAIILEEYHILSPVLLTASDIEIPYYSPATDIIWLIYLSDYNSSATVSILERHIELYHCNTGIRIFLTQRAEILVRIFGTRYAGTHDSWVTIIRTAVEDSWLYFLLLELFSFFINIVIKYFVWSSLFWEQIQYSTWFYVSLIKSNLFSKIVHFVSLTLRPSNWRYYMPMFILCLI